MTRGRENHSTQSSAQVPTPSLLHIVTHSLIHSLIRGSVSVYRPWPSCAPRGRPPSEPAPLSSAHTHTHTHTNTHTDRHRSNRISGIIIAIAITATPHAHTQTSAHTHTHSLTHSLIHTHSRTHARTLSYTSRTQLPFVSIHATNHITNLSLRFTHLRFHFTHCTQNHTHPEGERRDDSTHYIHIHQRYTQAHTLTFMAYVHDNTKAAENKSNTNTHTFCIIRARL